MTTIEITHTHESGTVVVGDPRPHHQALKAAGFRYSNQVGWYIRGSRDRDARTDMIERAAAGLLHAGLTVIVSIDNTARDPGEREADRADRAADRADGLRASAGRHAAEAENRFGAATAISDTIPLGQPILVGHHSERRHRRDLDRINRNMSAGVEAHQASKDAERRAKAAEAHQAARESGPVILRRLERLTAEQRGHERALTPCPVSGRKLRPEVVGRELDCPICYAPMTVDDDLTVAEHGAATGDHRDRLVNLIARNDADITYWRGQLELLKADGFHQWGPSDFQVGDRVNGNCTVVRANPKTLTVAHDAWSYIPGKHDKLPYDKVRAVTRDGQEVNPT